MKCKKLVGIVVAFACCSVALGALAVTEHDDVLLKALSLEMTRAIDEMRLPDSPDPYFIAYTVHEDSNVNVTAIQGGIARTSDNTTRRLTVELRVGSYELDNTNFFSFRRFVRPISVSLPLDNDLTELRRQIWLATDRAYRNAVELFASKKAALQNMNEQEREPDFSHVVPFRYQDSRAVIYPPREQVHATAVALSKLALKQQHLDQSRVVIFANHHRDVFLNSEGAHYSRVDSQVRIEASASTQASDDRTLSDYAYVSASRWDELPDLATMEEQVSAMHQRLAEVANAEPLGIYNGPILFKKQAATELVGLVLAPKLLADRRPVSPSPQEAQMLESQLPSNPFQNKLGARVTDRSLNVYDDPTLKRFDDQALTGFMPVDTDGVATQRTTLIERGVLRGLLNTRNPIKDIPGTGSRRAGSAPAISNLIVESRDGIPIDEMSEELQALIAERELEYGIVIERLSNLNIGTVSPMSNTAPSYLRGTPSIPVLEGYRVYPDGHRELFRNAVLAPFDVINFRDIIATSEDVYVHNTEYAFMSSQSLGTNSAVRVAVVSPDLLFEDLNIIEPSGPILRAPIVPHPLAASH